MFNLKNSLSRRFILFRLTASPAFLLTVIPSLLGPEICLCVIMVKFSAQIRLPSRYMVKYSFFLRIFSCLRKVFLPIRQAPLNGPGCLCPAQVIILQVSFFPLPVFCSGPTFPLLLPCGQGNRASFSFSCSMHLLNSSS